MSIKKKLIGISEAVCDWLVIDDVKITSNKGVLIKAANTYYLSPKFDNFKVIVTEPTVDTKNVVSEMGLENRVLQNESMAVICETLNQALKLLGKLESKVL